MYLYAEHHVPRMPKHAIQLVYSEIQTFQKGKIHFACSLAILQDIYFNSE